MSKASVVSRERVRPEFSTPIFDKYKIVPICAFTFALIVFPLLLYVTTPLYGIQEAALRLEPRIFWPAMAIISIILGLQNRSRLSKLSLSPPVICLLLHLAFAGLSVLWAFRPESSFTRFNQQVMVVISIVLPLTLAARTVDMVRVVYLCFAFSLFLNLLFVLGGSVTVVHYGSMGAVNIGYQGYFLGKNYLGECAVAALLLAIHESRYPGARRVSAIIVTLLAILLILLSDSKTALGLAIIAPGLAAVTLSVRKTTRISAALILLSIPFCYVILSNISSFNTSRISFMLYGDSTFTGRTVIWDFARYEIDRSPLVGWGYQSFWLVGSDAPSVVDAPGWVNIMPNAHNGYYDTMLELGRIGLASLLAFILATVHAAGRVADRDPARARLLLSISLFIIMYNFLESLWMRGFEFLWVLFVIVAVEIGRYWQPLPVGGAVKGSGSSKRGAPAFLVRAQNSRPHGRLP